MTRKIAYSEGWSWFKLNNLGLALGTNLKFYTSLSKLSKQKVRTFLGLIPTFVEFLLSTPTPSPQSLIWLKSIVGKVFPHISLIYFLLLKEFELKKPFSPFKDLDKFLKLIPAIYFPLTVTVRHRKVAF